MRIHHPVKLCDLERANCREVVALFDTGSTHSFIEEAILAGMPWAKTEPEDVKAGIVGGGPDVHIKTVARLKLDVGDCQWPTTLSFYAMRNLRAPVIIGAREMEEMGVRFDMSLDKDKNIIVLRNCETPVIITGIELEGWRRSSHA